MVYDMQACQYITNHSKAEVVVVENVAQLAKFTEVSGPRPFGGVFLQHTAFSTLLNTLLCWTRLLSLV